MSSGKDFEKDSMIKFDVMKNVFTLLFAVGSGLSLLSCACTKISDDSMKVVRDCTGTYLRFEGKDYHVCNLDKLSGFSDGQTVKASFKQVKKCNYKSQPDVVCMMYHENEGWIQILKVN